MKPELTDILACPVCKNSLELDVVEEKNGDVVAGSLHCNNCNYSYPIADGIPNLLPPNYED